MFWPVGYNALDREFRPGKPLSTEIRRRIVDLYERDRGKSHQQFVLLMAECAASFVIIKRTAHIFPLVKKDEEVLLNFQTTF